nr:immunoglobulin heavy chain junction region [Macaca mulatta]MOY21295.1 immunoglobulin heavy chain junction region [Macaca mulatta]MOY21320.1 immunoglobulin heavy chain junction region [Macaca mulatta]MOY21330.1 immunoglobulin heavy chain junction region [Macaca mulatta]MOY21746.1 immunoglobulin heavy chain junction region [Macaca mulatta]
CTRAAYWGDSFDYW